MATTIENISGNAISDGVIHGAAIVGGDNARVIFRHSQGLAVGGTDIAMTTRTIIDIASVSKAVATATALAICHDRGLIDFDAPFTEYLPEFRAELPAPIRVRDLAMHISGFGHRAGERRQYDASTGPEIMDNILAFPPLYRPGTHFEYACWNFLLLGRIVERLSGRSLVAFCHDEIFAPLAMHDSSMGQPISDGPQRLAQTEGCSAPGQISDYIARRVFRDGGCAGNAGVFSSADDLAIFCQCLLNHGCYGKENKALFSTATFAELTTNRMPDGMPKRSFGWVMADQYKPQNSSAKIIYHSGWSGQSIFADIAKKRFVVVLTTRCGDYDRAKQERTDIADEVFALMR
ncbi:MAG: serine hydrolase [Lentisphaeria bacterium]|nr:serine hydrolase [Lentisphaeria bacterium]